MFSTSQGRASLGDTFRPEPSQIGKIHLVESTDAVSAATGRHRALHVAVISTMRVAAHLHGRAGCTRSVCRANASGVPEATSAASTNGTSLWPIRTVPAPTRREPRLAQRQAGIQVERRPRHPPAHPIPTGTPATAPRAPRARRHRRKPRAQMRLVSRRRPASRTRSTAHVVRRGECQVGSAVDAALRPTGEIDLAPAAPAR